jgi:hypothetical protein
MMPKWMTFAFALFLSLQVLSTEGKDVDHAINNYIKAMGGTEKLHAVQSVHIEGMVTAAHERRAHLNISTILNRFLNGETSSGAGIAGSDLTSGHHADAKDILLERLSGRLFKFSFNVSGCTMRLADYIKTGQHAELVGNEIVKGRQTVRVKITSTSNQQVEYYLDAKSWLILREIWYADLKDQRSSNSVEQLDYIYLDRSQQKVVFPAAIVLNSTDILFITSTIKMNK